MEGLGWVRRSEETMGISCEDAWRDISDYIDEDLNPIQRATLDQHFAECLHCSALLDSMPAMVIALYRDERRCWLRRTVSTSACIRG